MNIESAINRVNDRIYQACKRVGRNENEVRLVAVSKTIPLEFIYEAFQGGQKVFGENKAQELRDKTSVGNRDIEWHFIGHLQTNKIKYVSPVVKLIHSVDSFNLAKEISDYNGKRNLVSDILLEVNTGGEISKFGLNSAEVEEVFLNISETLQNVKVKGLMCMAPYVEDEKVLRNSFISLRNIKDRLIKFIHGDQKFELSMGMSHDFELAVEEGSTMVRVGTAIFGGRGR